MKTMTAKKYNVILCIKLNAYREHMEICLGFTQKDWDELSSSEKSVIIDDAIYSNLDY
ncbi:hypothetical protein QE197_11915 [Arsenophonus nasoniae]|nr:hypothetical protein [Arsenophonus nasoniae]QBY44173.1 hypothetical protein ArsFIN_27500 [Arsenophonus nasoniae]WGM04472.1 hypothetical protein QE258_12645 [Arsenophonus nasoniae]WGM09578.1 hypothetical protein QE197_11915 [Arsenophonus nasoniae]WGM14299.1 hypothetical protein QE193_11810 [Arsenophonus nasoniae]CBA74258.1 hypothetical protein ARN_21890 [Arsenophonus nasoniae]